ncbi:MAG: hypothetical protein ACM3O8_00195 [Methylococcaceae bacterium]|nr:hypothetical protein [Prolixibacteraceae bacterium]
MTDKNDDIRKFSESMSIKYDILEEGIDIETQMEYLEYSHSFDLGELTEEQTLGLGNMLFDARIKAEGKKKALGLLAHLGTVTAFRQIEKYYNHPENEVKKWTALALQECKMFLESSLTDENWCIISSGLGGTDGKLRNYFLVLPLTDQQFTPIQHRIIEDEFHLIAKDLKCTIENVDCSDIYVGITVLIPVDVAIGIFIEKGIIKCNELGDFVFEYYYVTNTDIPDRQEITEIIKKVRED